MQILHILRLELYLLIVLVVQPTILIGRNNLLHTIYPTSQIALYRELIVLYIKLPAVLFSQHSAGISRKLDLIPCPISWWFAPHLLIKSVCEHPVADERSYHTSPYSTLPHMPSVPMSMVRYHPPSIFAIYLI